MCCICIFAAHASARAAAGNACLQGAAGLWNELHACRQRGIERTEMDGKPHLEALAVPLQARQHMLNRSSLWRPQCHTVPAHGRLGFAHLQAVGGFTLTTCPVDLGDHLHQRTYSHAAVQVGAMLMCRLRRGSSHTLSSNARGCRVRISCRFLWTTSLFSFVF